MKKQSRKVAKRCLAFLMVLFLLSINSFAAVVSDNDGSAFISKAEFDSLKNTFQTQIDQYNTSIDSKIDGAIATYLAGLRIATSYLEWETGGEKMSARVVGLTARNVFYFNKLGYDDWTRWGFTGEQRVRHSKTSVGGYLVGGIFYASALKGNAASFNSRYGTTGWASFTNCGSTTFFYANGTELRNGGKSGTSINGVNFEVNCVQLIDLASKKGAYDLSWLGYFSDDTSSGNISTTGITATDPFTSNGRRVYLTLKQTTQLSDYRSNSYHNLPILYYDDFSKTNGGDQTDSTTTIKYPPDGSSTCHLDNMKCAYCHQVKSFDHGFLTRYNFRCLKDGIKLDIKNNNSDLITFYYLRTDTLDPYADLQSTNTWSSKSISANAKSTLTLNTGYYAFYVVDTAATSETSSTIANNITMTEVLES